MAIARLDPLVVNQIAAGEVIERPASVVKELIENAIDAGATRISVTIENGGRDLVQVADDGSGIPFAELELAVAPHATSKIESTQDLEAIGTLGFRGEAIASIASVSRLTLVSRPRDASEAGRIDVDGGAAGSPRPSPGAVGTTVTVRNLFFNTPARRKFLRAESTEWARIVQTAEALALGYPHVGVTVRCVGHQGLDLPAARGSRQRMLDVLGPELGDALLEVSADDGGVVIRGLAGKPEIARGTARHVRVFLNGRPITDRSIAHAIKEAYRGLIDPTRHPTIVLFLEIDPRQSDVNVHPTKAEVRFRHPATVHNAVLAAVRRTLRGADLTPELDLAHASPAAGARPAFGAGWPGEGGGQGGGQGGATAAFVEHFRRLDPVQKGFVYSEVKQALAADEPQLEILPAVRPVTDVLQVHSSYLVTQDDQGLLIIDQHALHERVMFERLLAAVGKGNLESQRLLMPAMIEVDPAKMELLQGLEPLLRRIGIEAEPAGPSAIAVHGFSSFLFERRVDPQEFFGDLFDKAQSGTLGAEPEAALHETLDMMACKAAVKAGDRLTPKEIADLLAQREAVERSSNCPHGRPTTLRLTIRDLERQFGRK